jgi:hypothetical protein
MSNRKIILTLAIVFTLAFITCDNGDDKTHTHQWQWVVTTPATATAEGLETETCATCGATNGTRPIEQTEPANKGPFAVSFNFANPGNPDDIIGANIQDTRTACGSADLEHVEVGNKNIVTIIEEAIQGAFSNVATTNAERGRFRNVFRPGVTIIVDNLMNPTDSTKPAYKLKATDSKTIYFHIDYLKSSPSDIQQKILDAVTAMNPVSPNLPYEAE